MGRTTGARGAVDEAAEHSAQPTLVRATIERLVELRPDVAARLDADERLRAALVGVVAASRSLTRLLLTDPSAIEVLASLHRRPPVSTGGGPASAGGGQESAGVDALVAWKRRELLRITARDVTGIDDLEATGAALAALATDVLAAAVALSGGSGVDIGTPDPAVGTLAVIGMGKLGGEELNYASDIDLLLVGDGPIDRLERRARAVLTIARRCFRVDVDLRPEGRDGPLVRSLDSYEAYWHRWAEPWELQALLKARPVAGDLRLGARFADTAGRWLWSHPFDTEEIRSLRALKRRSEDLVARRRLTDRDIKRGRGGIRDIEFTVQLLQLVHGHADPGLRRSGTLPVLRELAAAGYVDPADAIDLADAYRFLRRVEHRLQLEEERQVHTVPEEGAAGAWDRLARVLGYRGRPEASAAGQLQRDLVAHQLSVRAIHERIYFRPLLEAFGRLPTEASLSTLSPAAARTRLAAFGFTDPVRTEAAVRELTRGLTRASRLMQQMLPLLLDWLSVSPNPDLGLLMLRTLLSGTQRRAQLVAAFRESPEVARRLCLVAGTSRTVADILAHHPDLVPRLVGDERLRARPVNELVASAREAISWRTDPRDRQAGLRRWKERRLAGIAARDILGSADVEEVGADLTHLAEATLEVALGNLAPQVPFCVLAAGRFGGAELSYASDLDVLFVFDGGAGAADEALRVASGLLQLVGGTTPAERLYPIDAALRPEGRQGALARSVGGYAHYWDRYALVWERQAMVRARPVAGDRDLGHRLLETLAPRVWGAGLSPADTREIRRMKARIERERIPVGEDPQFHLKLGRGSLWDVEWTAQLLQLGSGVDAPGTMEALRDLVAAGALSPTDGDQLMTSYRFCERTRNRWFLIAGRPSGALPTAPDEALWLARSLETTPTGLREEYRRVTRRARRVVERVFYGQDRPAR